MVLRVILMENNDSLLVEKTMSIITICFVEIICLVFDLFYFHAAVSHIIFVCVLIVAGLVSLFKNRRRSLYAFIAIPIVLALSTTGYLIEGHLKNVVSDVGNVCFTSNKCDLPKNYFGYRIQLVYKAQGRAKNMIVIDGYNHSSLIYDPALNTFERAEM